MARIYNWGIIGLGKIAHKFAGELLNVKNARLHAVASRSLERSKTFAKKYNVSHIFGSYAEIVNCPNLDVVYIATPHTTHCANTIMCLEHQIPVLCEKPFAMNTHEVKGMISLAKFQNTFLMEAMWTRFLPSMKKVLSLIGEGAIGEVTGLEADFGFQSELDPNSRLFNQNMGGGALLDVGIYPVFLSLLLFGKPLTLKAVANIGKTNVDETCAILMKYPDNKMAILHASIVTNTNTEAVVHGTSGSIRLHPRWHETTKITLHKKNGSPENFNFNFNFNLNSSSRGYRYEIEEVMNCLDQGKKESELLNLDFSLDLMELLDDIRLEAGIFYPQFDQFTKEISKGSIKFSSN